MPTMRMRVKDELWLEPTGDGGWEIAKPWIVNRNTGESAPGLVKPEHRPFVIRPGTVVYMEVPGLLPTSRREEQRQAQRKA